MSKVSLNVENSADGCDYFRLFSSNLLTRHRREVCQAVSIGAFSSESKNVNVFIVRFELATAFGFFGRNFVIT